MAMTLKDIEKVMKLMVKNQIATFECEGMKLTKNIHIDPKARKRPEITISPAPMPINYSSPDDIMFLNSKAPKMSLDEWDRFTAPTAKVTS
jgi:hypothetical protein